jgi:hypothetical protein
VGDLAPLPGEPDLLLQDATMYSRTADAIQDAIARIGELASSDFSSDAVSALRGQQGDLVSNVGRAYARYSAVGGALTDYARALRAAQDEANAAIAAHDGAADQLSQLTYPMADAAQRAAAPGPDQVLAMTDLARLTDQQQQLQAVQGQAVRMWEEAAAAARHAASVAAGRIDAGNDANHLNDSFWDTLSDVVDVLNVVNAFLREVLKIVSLVMTILAIVFVVLAIFFQPFAAVAAALFGYAQLVNLAIALLALLQFLMDGFHLLDLVVVGIAVVAAFGGSVLGKVLGTATDAAVNTALSGFGEAAAKAAGTAASQAVTTAVREVTNDVVNDVLDLGSDDARTLYSDLGPAASGFLSTSLSGGVGAATGMAGQIGGWVGGDFRDGIAATGLPDVAHAILEGGGQAMGPVLDQVGGAVQQIDTGVSAFQHAAQSGIATATGSVSGFTAQGQQLGSQLGSGFQAPDLGRQITDMMAGLGKSALGSIPGGNAVADVWGHATGALTQSMQAAVTHGGMGTSWTGTGR